jgi:hypothetical protein
VDALRALVPGLGRADPSVGATGLGYTERRHVGSSAYVERLIRGTRNDQTSAGACCDVR